MRLYDRVTDESGSGRDQIEVLPRYLRKYQSVYPVCRSRFESSTTRMRVYSVTAMPARSVTTCNWSDRWYNPEDRNISETQINPHSIHDEEPQLLHHGLLGLNLLFPLKKTFMRSPCCLCLCLSPIFSFRIS